MYNSRSDFIFKEYSVPIGTTKNGQEIYKTFTIKTFTSSKLDIKNSVSLIKPANSKSNYFVIK